MPILLTVGIMLIILMALSFSLAPTELAVEVGPDGQPVDTIDPNDNVMVLPPPRIFSQPWARWVALATCLPLGLAMLGISVMFMVSASGKIKELRVLDQELAQIQ